MAANLSAGLKASMTKAAGKSIVQETVTSKAAKTTTQAAGKNVLIGALYPPHVRRALKMVEATTGNDLKSLLGEAINDLCAKYGQPQPYTAD